MERRKMVGLAALAVLAAVPVRAQYGTGFFPGSQFGSGLGSATESQKLIEIQLAAAERELALAEARFRTGQTPPAEAEQARSKVEQLKTILNSIRERAVREKRQQSLNQPVNIDLREATVRQATDALNKAVGVPIRAGEGVSPDTRLTVLARGVPLSSVLEAIGRQADLAIGHDPEDPRGIELRTWPVLEVNGQRQQFRGRQAPWTDEWGEMAFTVSIGTPGFSGFGGFGGVGGDPAMVPGAGGGFAAGAPPAAPGAGRGGSGYPGLPGATPPAASGYAPPSAPDPGMGSGMPGMMGMPGMPGMAMPGMSGMMGGEFPGPMFGGSSAGAVSVAALNNRLVVATPGVGKAGEAGVWLTVYQLDGSQLKKMSTTFQAGSQARPAPARPPQPRSTQPRKSGARKPATAPTAPFGGGSFGSTDNRPGGQDPAAVLPGGGLPAIAAPATAPRAVPPPPATTAPDPAAPPAPGTPAAPATAPDPLPGGGSPTAPPAPVPGGAPPAGSK